MVSRAELARRLGVTPRAVTAREQKGHLTPRNADGFYELHRALWEWTNNRMRPTNNGTGGARSGGGSSLDWGNELKREQYRKARLERRELQGSLVRRDAVERARADLGVQVRDKLRQIPAKLAAKVAAETDPRACREIIAKAIDKVLADLADVE